jgi:hypothetical protein
MANIWGEIGVLLDDMVSKGSKFSVWLGSGWDAGVSLGFLLGAG